MRPKLRLLEDALITASWTKPARCSTNSAPRSTTPACSRSWAITARVSTWHPREPFFGRADRSALASTRAASALRRGRSRDPLLRGRPPALHAGLGAITVLDGETGRFGRRSLPTTSATLKVVSGLPHIAAQSTAMIPSDVPSRISDSYRSS